MKKVKISRLPALAFFAALLILFGVGLRVFFASLYTNTNGFRGIDKGVFKRTETWFNENLPTKGLFVDFNGFLDRATGKRTDAEYCRLNNGNLTYVVPKENTEPLADAVVSLHAYLQNTLNKPLLYVQFPFSIDPNDEQLPPGMEDHSNENADAFLARLSAKGVQTYDLRPYFESLPDYYSRFYRTDHHWKAEAGFDAARELTNRLAAVDKSYAVDARVTDLTSYRVESYDNFFGSTGRHFGYGYCGYETFSAISPAFDLTLTVNDEDGALLHSGGAESTVLFPEKLTYEDHYDCRMYGYYLDGDQGYRHFVNHTSGLNVAQKKLLVIKDSYANVLLPYLIYGYAEVTVVDLRHITVPLTEVIERFDPDLTIVSYNPGALTQSNEVFFRFFQ